MPSLSSALYRLEAVAHRLGWGATPPLAFALDGGNHPAEAHLLDPADPLEALVGLTAAPWWGAIAVVAEAHARTTDGPRSGRIGVAVPRCGSAVVLLRDRSDDRPRVQAPDEAHGLLLDLCRRTLGLPTAPAPPITQLWTAVWLDQLLEAAVQGAPPCTWAEAASLHPAGREAGWPEPTPDELCEIAADLVARREWSDLRTGRAPTPHGRAPGPVAAEWMDDGLYARAVLSALPDPLDALADLWCLLPHEVAAGVERVALGPPGCIGARGDAG